MRIGQQSYNECIDQQDPDAALLASLDAQFAKLQKEGDFDGMAELVHQAPVDDPRQGLFIELACAEAAKRDNIPRALQLAARLPEDREPYRSRAYMHIQTQYVKRREFLEVREMWDFIKDPASVLAADKTYVEIMIEDYGLERSIQAVNAVQNLRRKTQILQLLEQARQEREV